MIIDWHFVQILQASTAKNDLKKRIEHATSTKGKGKE